MKNTLILTISKFFEKGTMFLFFILLAQQFGSDSFGEFSYYFTIGSILFVIFDVGGEFYQIREFTRHESLKVFHNIFILKTLVACAVFLIALITQQATYLLVLIGSFYLDSIISVFRSSLYKNGLYYHEAILTVTEKAIFILLVSLNLFTMHDLVFMYLSLLGGKLAYLLVASKRFYAFKYLKSHFRLFDWRYFKNYAFNSWSYVLHALLVVVFVQIDIVMLKWMGISFDKIGLYSAAVKIYMTVIIFADILFKQYYPKVSKLIHDHSIEKLKLFTLKIQSLNIFISLFFALVTMLFANDIMALAFGPSFAEAGNMLVLLALVIVFRFSMYTYTAILSSSSLNYIKIVTSVTCVLVNVALNLILIPHYGVYGALVSTIITEFVLVAMYKVSSFRIVFTNYFTTKEFSALTLALLFVYVLLNYEIVFIYRLAVASTLVFVLLLNRTKLQASLAFEG